jgi:hypothetical protein
MKRDTVTIELEFDGRTIRQSPDDIEQLACGNGDFTLGEFCSLGGCHHFDFKIGSGQRQLPASNFDQQVGQHRKGLAAFDYTDHLLQGLEQGFSLNAELHGLVSLYLLFCLYKRSLVAVVGLVDNFIFL